MVDGWKSCIVSAKSFKIAIPGIWTLNGKNLRHDLHRSGELNEIVYTRNLIFYPCNLFFGEEIGRENHQNEKKVVKKKSP